MMSDLLCARCGEEIPPEESDCPYCAHRKQHPFFHREPVLVVAIVVLAVVLWALTHAATQAYGHREDHLARTWYADGQSALRAGRLEVAISDFRNALVYSHDSPKVRLNLAQALALNGNVRQAQAYLRALWEEQPGDGTINLELARLAVRTGNVLDAQRFYHGAIYGVWDGNDPVALRRAARLELVRFLLNRQTFQQAQSELIALSVDLPRDPKLMTEVGQMFLEAGDTGRALNEFQEVTKMEPRNGAAFAGAGAAAFERQDYALARRYLERAVAFDAKEQRVAQLLETANQVLQMDPYVARIGRAERNRRVQRALEQTQYRLEKCAEQLQTTLTAQPPQDSLATDYAQLLALRPRINDRALRDDPDLVDAAMELVFRSQDDAAAKCGAGQGPDAALVLIGRAHGGRP